MTRNDLLFSIPLGDWVDTIIRWMMAAWDGFFDVIGEILIRIYDGIYWALSTPPFWVLIIVFAAIAFLPKAGNLHLPLPSVSF